MTKQQLRKIYKQKRAALSPEIQVTWNAAILSQLKDMDWSTCQYCHLYLPIQGSHEPDTLQFVSWIHRTFPEIHIVVSKSNPEDLSMAHYLFNDAVELVHNKWGIPEPIDGMPVAESLIDVILVPMLICDRKGNRVGYGKGFYDRFLAKCRPDTLKVALSFFDPVDIIEDSDVYDVPLDICITPRQTYTFK